MRIEAGRGSSDLDEMLENFAYSFGIRCESQHAHLRSTFAASQRVHLVYLGDEPCPGSLAFCGRWAAVSVGGWWHRLRGAAGVRMKAFPTGRSKTENVRLWKPLATSPGRIESIPADVSESFEGHVLGQLGYEILYAEELLVSLEVVIIA